jgi:hypothetical protein
VITIWRATINHKLWWGHRVCDLCEMQPELDYGFVEDGRVSVLEREVIEAVVQVPNQ